MIKWGTPLGRVFKIHDIFDTVSSDFLTSINYMDKWVTPLGVRLHLGEQPFS